MKNFTLVFAAMALSFCASAQLINPGFESGLAVGWTESSTNFETPLCDAACGVCGGPCVPQAGSWYAWFGGAGTNEEVGAVSQVITIPNGTAGNISFWVKVPTAGDGSADDVVVVAIDGEVLFSVNASQAAQYTEYTEITVDISDYTDGGQHVFGAVGNQNGGSNILFDSFNLEVDGNSSVGFDQQINGERDFVLYPNPADTQINLHFGQRLDGEATVRILDSNGRVVSEQLVGGISGKLLSLETSWMPVGMYVVEVENGAELIRERISIVH
jgi:hypothetical protein